MPRPMIRYCCGLALLAAPLGACTMGPAFHPPASAAPADWSAWRTGAAELHAPVGTGAVAAEWWRALGDPVLDELETRALAGNADLKTAALHFAEARVSVRQSAAAGLPQVNASAAVTHDEASQYATSTRLFDHIGPNRDALAALLAEPFTLYQGGFDASWELDLWGKVRRSVEAARADSAASQALLDAARIALSAEVARAWSDWRASRQRIVLTRALIADLAEQRALAEMRRGSGITDRTPLERARSDLAVTDAQLPALEAAEGEAETRIALLLGVKPQALSGVLPRSGEPAPVTLPDLAAGLPSDVAKSRPDIRAAIARLHAATARIGVAEADFYPAFRLGANLDLQSYRTSQLFDWRSHDASFGPSISLPLFDGGRRRATLRLSELQAKEAAVAFEDTVLKAWGEINDALNRYDADSVAVMRLTARRDAVKHNAQLIGARVAGGIGTRLDVIGADLSQINAERELADAEAVREAGYIAVIKATATR